MYMDSSGILSIVAIVTSVGGALLAMVNHSRIRSNCLGRKIELSIDVDRTIPSPVEGLKIAIPAESVNPRPISV
jgi:hypothetical protein